MPLPFLSFHFHDPPATETHPLSLHDALPICRGRGRPPGGAAAPARSAPGRGRAAGGLPEKLPGPRPRYRRRSEEHTSELQSRLHLVCRLLLEKKKQKGTTYLTPTLCYLSLPT